MPQSINPSRSSKVVDLRKLTAQTPPLPKRNISPTNQPARNFRANGLRQVPAKKKSHFNVFIILILFLIAAATAIGFFAFGSNKSANESVKLSLVSPKEISSGEEVTLQLVYENRDRISLQKIEVVMQYPEGFFFDRSNLKPTGNQNNIWQLPDLEPGKGGKIEIVGQLVGQLEEQKKFKATFYYEPANFNSNFKSELESSVYIKDVLLKVDLTKPENLAPGSDFEFKVNYQNTTDTEMEDLIMSLDLGNDFNLIESTPTTTKNLIWNLDKVAAKESGELIVKGNFPEASANEEPWLFKVQQKLMREGKIQDRLLYQEEGTIKLVNPEVSISLAFKDDQPVSWQGNLGYLLRVENRGSVKADNAKVILKFSTDLIDWSKVDQDDKLTRTGDSLIWDVDNSEVGQKLKEILPGSVVEIEAVVPIIDQPTEEEIFNPENLIISAQAILDFRAGEKDYSVKSEQQVIFIGAEPSLSSEVRYYLNDQQVGQGPLPPVVGQQTSYRIYWIVFSGSRGLNNVKVKATLPSYINWVGQADQATIASQFNYQQANREVVWQIDSLGPNTQVMISFDVAVIPEATQVGQILVLANPASLQAQAKETNQAVFKINNLLTSELVSDPQAQGKSRVTAG